MLRLLGLLTHDIVDLLIDGLIYSLHVLLDLLVQLFVALLSLINRFFVLLYGFQEEVPLKLHESVKWQC